ncbi:4-amino-4-deoxy-L-arabinose transferase [Mariniphaga anaerophila]|uniref:4-amino-4-deoxy-L-arabinose transferase n=1 Tax=Mariniphaga anaerophila TaxID=1484053 RepID=A0A1M5E2Y4_9BACT|nr:4-amino-4-deoxy-L-arabinose transferase [Mariniphaga anaerophila]
MWTVAFLVGFAAWFFGLFIDLTGDSGLYAAISRQMVESGDWLNLKINGEPYEQKPHLFFWLAGLGIQLFGNSNWAFKLLPFIFAVSSVYFSYRLAKLLFGKHAGNLAALITGTSQMFFLYLLDFHTDSVLQAAVVFAVWQLAEYLKKGNSIHFVLGFTGVGLAMLTKGPVGAVLPFLFVLSYLLLKKDFRQLFHPKWILGVLLVLIIISPTLYHLWKSFGAEGFRFYFIDNNIGRVTGKVAGSSTDPFFYLYNLLWAFLPWTLFVIFAIAGEIESWFTQNTMNKTNAALLCSILVLLLVFSIAKGKAPNYVLMFVPLIAVITSGRMQVWLQREAPLPKGLFYVQVSVLILISALLVFAGVTILESGIVMSLLFLLAIAVLFGVFMLAERSRLKRLLFSSVTVIVVFNLYLNTQLIPFLYSYQGHRQVLEIFEGRGEAVGQLYSFGLEEYELFFNAKDSVISIVSWRELYESRNEAGKWVYTEEDKFVEMLFLGLPIDTVYQIRQRGMNRISLDFLTRKSRDKSLSANYLVRLKRNVEAMGSQNVDSLANSLSRKMGFFSPYFDEFFFGKEIKSLHINRKDEYTPPVIIPLDGLRKRNQLEFKLALEYRGQTDFAEKDVVLVMSVEKEKQNLLYRIFPLQWTGNSRNWETAIFTEEFTADLPPGALLSFYIWNKTGKQVEIKSMDVKVTSE